MISDKNNDELARDVGLVIRQGSSLLVFYSYITYTRCQQSDHRHEIEV